MIWTNRYYVQYPELKLGITIKDYNSENPRFSVYCDGSIHFNFYEYKQIINNLDVIASVNPREGDTTINVTDYIKIHRRFISDISKDYNLEFHINIIDKKQNLGHSVYIRGIERLKIVRESLVKLNERYQEDKWLDEKIRSSGIQYIEFNGKKIEVEKKYSRLNLRNLGIKKITDIKGLNEIQYLKILNLYNNEIEEIEGLDHLKHLRILYLHKNNIKEIRGLDNLENLEELHLSFNPISSVKALKGLENLSTLIRLNLEGTQLPKELFKDAGITDPTKAQDLVKYLIDKKDEAREYEGIKLKTIEYIMKASSVFEEITFSKIRSKSGIELQDLEEIAEEMIFSGKINAKIRKDGIAFIEENPLIGIALEAVDVLHEIKDDTELISQYTSYIEDVFDKTENIEEFLKSHLESEFEKIKNAWQDYKDGKIDRRDFIKTGIKEIGKKFIKIFIKKI